MTNIPQSVARSAEWTAALPMQQPSMRTASHARIVLLIALVMIAVPTMLGQALPAAEAAPISTGFALPRTAGTLNYGISASESLILGYNGNQGTTSGTNLTGDLGFISNSKLYPFSMVFSGGHSWAMGEPSYSFLSLALSQVVNVKRWNFVLSDSVSYLPGTPAGGLSGVPGVGDLGVGPVQVGADTGQGILTAYSDRVANTTTGSVQRQLTGRTSVSASGSYGISRFVGAGGEGLDSDSTTGGGGMNYQLDSRTSFGGNFAYSSFSYPGNSIGIATPGFTSQTASVQLTHQLTRKLSMSVSVGPQWSHVDSPGSPDGISAYANASIGYSGRFFHASLNYTRGTNSGSGAVGGASSQGGGVSIDRTFARVWNCSATASYTESSSLPSANTNTFAIATTVASAQVSRAIMRSISAYASYTFEHQSSPSIAAVDAFSGREQVIGFGLTYSPSSIHLGRQ